MPNRNQRRARPCFTPVRGKATSEITAADYPPLIRRLIADPRFVLSLFANSNLAYLSELSDWPRLRKTHPDIAERILAVATELGIPEKPEKR